MVVDRRLLVTGAGGQLGRALARLVPSGTFLSRQALNVCNVEAVFEAFDEYLPEIVVHAAAYTGVDAAETDRQTAGRVNVVGTRVVAEAAEKSGAIFVYPSSDYVFSGDKDGEYSEEDETGPLGVYGDTKLQGETMAERAERHLIVRTGWVFGEGKNFVRTIIEVAKGGATPPSPQPPRDEVAVVDDQRGRPTYALDLAEGILALLGREATGTFHLAGSGEPATWADLAELALNAAGLRTKVRRVSTAEYYAGRPGPIARRPMNSVLDCSKADALGVRLRPWKEAVEAYVKEHL